MDLLLIYPPFCTPTTIPYSISYLKNFIENNSNIKVKCLDLNAKFHRLRFNKYYEEIRKKENQGLTAYSTILSDFDKESRPVYSKNHKKIVNGKKPELINEMLSLITKENPKLIAFSLVYNSQCFYALALIRELSKKGIKCIIGGPSSNSKLKETAIYLKNEIELIAFLEKEDKKTDYNCSTIPDFSDYDEKDYLSKEAIIPLKSSSSCYYRKCTFCTHHANSPYIEYDLKNIKDAIIKSKKKHFFFIDDMISKTRIFKIAKLLKPLKVKWWCQLRPTKEYTCAFNELYDSGLRCIAWGIESGNQRILSLIKKGTNPKDITKILAESHNSKIKNIAYIIFGFPTETKEEFLDTINFLKENQKNIDLVSTSVFGLQKGSRIYENPELFGITCITEEKRTVLEEKISYTVKSGMQNKEAKTLRKRYSKTIKNIDKAPRAFNYFKEQIILFD